MTKSNLLLFSLYYAEVRYELAGPISASLRPSNTAFEMSQQWRAVSNTVSDLTDPKCEPRTPAPETNALPLDSLKRTDEEVKSRVKKEDVTIRIADFLTRYH